MQVQCGGGGGGSPSNRSPLIAELAREAVQVVDVLFGPHDHLEGRDELVAGRTVPRDAKQPETTQRRHKGDTGLLAIPPEPQDSTGSLDLTS